MISVNATLIVQVVLFLAFLFAMNRIMIQPLHQMVLEREDLIVQKKEELAAARRTLEQVAQDYRNRLRQAEREARAVKEGLHQDANEQAGRVLKSAQEQVASVRKKVRDQVSAELEKALRELKQQAETLSVEISQKVVGRRV